MPFVLLERRKTSKKYQGNEPEDIDVELREYYNTFQPNNAEGQQDPPPSEKEDDVFEMKPQ